MRIIEIVLVACGILFIAALLADNPGLIDWLRNQLATYLFWSAGIVRV
jgi:hypothetical protein